MELCHGRSRRRRRKMKRKDFHGRRKRGGSGMKIVITGGRGGMVSCHR